MVEYGLRFYLYRSLLAPEFTDHADIFKPHPTRGWALAPGTFGYATKRDYKTGVRVNSHGLRDDEHAFEKPEGVFRILILGDSFMEAHQVPMKKALPYLLEKELSEYRIEVINSGVNGYSTTQQLVYLKEEGLRYQPDLVLQAFFVMNDAIENYRPLLSIATGTDSPLVYSRPFSQWNESDGALTISKPDYDRAMATYEEGVAKRAEYAATATSLERTTVHRYYTDWKHKRENESGMTRVMSNIWYGVCLSEFDLSCREASPYQSGELMRRFDEAWMLTEHVLAETKRTSESADARYAAFLVPGKFQIDDKYRSLLERHACGPLAVDLWKPNRILAKIGQRNDFRICDLGTVLVDQHNAGSAPLYFGYDDLHWTAFGHRIATVELAQWLATNNLLSKSSP